MVAANGNGPTLPSFQVATQLTTSEPLPVAGAVAVNAIPVGPAITSAGPVVGGTGVIANVATPEMSTKSPGVASVPNIVNVPVPSSFRTKTPGVAAGFVAEAFRFALADFTALIENFAIGLSFTVTPVTPYRSFNHV